eukprot:15356677-Ditylum_brightwellii.AAC.2
MASIASGPASLNDFDGISLELSMDDNSVSSSPSDISKTSLDSKEQEKQIPATLTIPSNEDNKIERGIEKEAVDLTKLTTLTSTQSKVLPSMADLTVPYWNLSHFLTR